MQLFIYKNLCYTLNAAHILLRVMKLNRRDLLILIPSMCLIAAIALLPAMSSKAVFSAARWPEQTLLIDAGHGGEDGGAVAISGTSESGINLSIALKLDQLCGLFGIHAQLLRETDTSLADKSALTLREKKRSDLLKRTELVNDTANAVLISIHQNNYSNTSIHGAQVFYHDDEVSADWGVYTQSLLSDALDPANNRVSKPISEDVYLMNHIDCRALLVECGFLSNPEEDALLETDSYQTKLASVLLASYTTYLPVSENEQSEMISKAV